MTWWKRTSFFPRRRVRHACGASKRWCAAAAGANARNPTWHKKTSPPCSTRWTFSSTWPVLCFPPCLLVCSALRCADRKGQACLSLLLGCVLPGFFVCGRSMSLLTYLQPWVTGHTSIISLLIQLFWCNAPPGHGPEHSRPHVQRLGIVVVNKWATVRVSESGDRRAEKQGWFRRTECCMA